MSAVEDRLTATLAKHVFGWEYSRDGYCRGCSWRSVLAPDDAVSAHRAHVAAVITSSDDLAVVELPTPDEHDSEGTRWVLTPGFGVQALAEGGVEFGLPIVGTADDARRLAGMSAAAAKAAEAVSDRGE